MITLTTCETYPELPENLLPLKKALNFNVATWQTQPNNGVILPLCAWDYAQNADEFLNWLNKIENSGAKIFNSLDLVRWNMRKSYLIDLAEKGIDTIPTFLIDNHRAAILQFMQENQYDDVVIKPIVGQSGAGVEKIHIHQDFNLQNENIGKIIIQPFMREIMHLGETCLIFFGGTFSHAVWRQPAPNEWRANSAFGVKIHAIQVDSEIVQQAQHVINTLPETPLYARVDGMVIGKKLILNELELIEPSLYWQCDNLAVARFLTAFHTIML